MSAALANEPMAKLGCESVEEPDFDELLVAAFEQVAVTFASRIALGSDVWEPTYRELNETANCLAHRLIACGVVLGGHTAILMSHDAPIVAGVLGILKAGQIVVALNPDDPVSQLKMLVEDAEPSVIVTDGQNQKFSRRIRTPHLPYHNFRIKNRDRTGRKSLDRNLARANGVSDLYVRHNRSPKGCDENPPTASESRCRSHRGHAVYGE